MHERVYRAPEPQAPSTVMRESNERAADTAARELWRDGDSLYDHRVHGFTAQRLQSIGERHQEADELFVTLRDKRQLGTNEWQQRPAVVKELLLGNRRVEEVSLEARQQQLKDRAELGVRPGDVEWPDGHTGPDERVSRRCRLHIAGVEIVSDR